MTTERDPATRIVLSWLREDAHENAEHVLLRALDEVDATQQRRSAWPARRFTPMNTYAKLGIAAATVLVVAIAGYKLVPWSPGFGGRVTPGPTVAASPTPSPTTSPTPEPTPSARPHTFMPFGPRSNALMCPPPTADPDCVEDPRDQSITVTYTLPAGWDEIGGAWIDENAPPAGAAVTFNRGSWLFSEPCRPQDVGDPDIPVGPSVDDLVTALVDHPLLDVTPPVDVALAGYSGSYLELQVPDDISACERYRPIAEHIYAQGPGQRWRMWVLDVDGVRMLIEINDFATTPAARLAEAQAIIDSIVITP
jgi:hypothetical protein